MTSLFWFWFVIPNFCLTVTVFRDYCQRDAPAFLSLFYRFWLGGLFSFERLTVYVIGNHPCLLIPKERFLFFDVVRCITNWEFATSMRIFFWINWDTTLPQVYIKGFDCLEQKTPTSLARRGWLGIIFLITPVFGNWKKCLYIISKVCSKAYCIKSWYCFVILPLKACSFLSRVKYHKEKHKSSETNGWIQDKHMQCINENRV